ncbi:hypothetical protein [Actinoplanes siamensis]|uniref:Uncharacterized protein n=1 Tax=Actinoplanes siamensis TaxID=1223317 RepID=A0A919TN91_9ACTN|nr:hypothetical protein [Actinoplanes siamensis]GIF08482.1 hypothetical protein Asi03nite_60200 [Actinoplanes siamensis]
MTTDSDVSRANPRRGFVRLAYAAAAVSVLAGAAAIAVHAAWHVGTSLTQFTTADIATETRPASAVSETDLTSHQDVTEHLARERAAGRHVDAGDAKLAVLRSPDGTITVHLVWSGIRSPTGLAVVVGRAESEKSSVALAMTATTPTGPQARTLPRAVDRQAQGGARSTGGLELKVSDCIDAWVTAPRGSLQISSCAELWHGSAAPEWIYRQFSDATTVPGPELLMTEMSIRSRIPRTLRSQTTGPTFVASCSDTGQTSILAGPVEREGVVSNPSLHMRSTPCTGFQDRIKKTDQQIGGFLDGLRSAAGTIETTGSYLFNATDPSPTWEDYSWSQAGCVSGDGTGCGSRIDESKFIHLLW